MQLILKTDTKKFDFTKPLQCELYVQNTRDKELTIGSDCITWGGFVLYYTQYLKRGIQDTNMEVLSGSLSSEKERQKITPHITLKANETVKLHSFHLDSEVFGSYVGQHYEYGNVNNESFSVLCKLKLFYSPYDETLHGKEDYTVLSNKINFMVDCSKIVFLQDSCYAMVGKKIYYYRNQYNVYSLIQTNIDIKSYSILAKTVIKDNKRVYIESKLIRGMDIDTLTLYGEHVIGDTKSIKSAYKALRIEDIDSFVYVGHNIYKDKFHAYCLKCSDEQIRKIKGCQKVDTLRVNKYGTPICDDFAYIDTKKIKGIDVESYQFLNGGYAKDKHFVYENYEKKLKGVDPSTFEPLRDKRLVTTQDYIEDGLKFKGKSTQGLKKLSSDYYVDDNKTVFYNTAIMNNVDTKSFEVFGDSNYAKDKDNIFFQKDSVKGADIDNFEVLIDPLEYYRDNFKYYARDKNFLYCKGYKVEKNEILFLYDMDKNLPCFLDNVSNDVKELLK